MFSLLLKELIFVFLFGLLYCTENFNKLKAKVFKHLVFLYTTFLHFILGYRTIKSQLIDLIEHTFRREKILYLAFNPEPAFFTSEEHRNIMHQLFKELQKRLFIFKTIFIIIFGFKLYRHNVRISMGTNCAMPCC